MYGEWKFCSILSGVSVVTRDGEASRDVVAGDAFVIQPDFAGIREVVETARKLFVVRNE